MEGTNMNYKEMLNKIIKESGLTNKEILDICEKLGEKITPNYLSVLKNQENKIASDNLSVALAKACGTKHEEVLVVQAYLDRAPDIILSYLNKVYKQTLHSSIAIFEHQRDSLPEEIRREFDDNVKHEIENLSLAEFICETRQDEYDFDLNKVLEQQEKPKPIKWALVPIADNNPIKILTGEDVKLIEL